MALVKFKKTRTVSDVPQVSIRQGRFHYNATFGRLADLEKKKSVVYHLDAVKREIHFQFLGQSSDEDAYTLENRGGVAKCRSAATDLIKKNIWIRSVATKNNDSLKSFEARREKSFWVIRLCPAFEYSLSKNDLGSLPSDARGIYKYLNIDGATVYIGKGVIRARAQDPERIDWNFETIEYSLIDSESDQFEWEAFWIDRYLDDHAGELPAYNRQGGNRS